MIARKPVRIQLRRTKGWRKPEGAVVVTRPGRWGNPYLVGAGPISYGGPVVGAGSGFYDPEDVRGCDMTLPGGLSAAQAVWLYREDLVANLEDGDPFFNELRSALEGLRGRDLGCWCPLSAVCHADVLLELANR